MRFMIIVKATSDSEAGVMPPGTLMAEMAAYHQQLAQAGILLDCAGLQASSKGWRILYTGKNPAERSLSNGPFADSQALVAGYTLIQVRSREEALEWTRRYPNPAIDGGQAEIEVRQLFEPEDFGSGDAADRF